MQLRRFFDGTWAAGLIGSGLLLLSLVVPAAQGVEAGERDRRTPSTRVLERVQTTRVHDGDTISIRAPDGTVMRLRLLGIDAPELDQAFGKASRAHLWRLVGERALRVELHGKDRYHRELAVIPLSAEDARSLGCTTERGDAPTINACLVAQGMAWAYRERPEMLDWQNEARARRVGLWERGRAVPPWEWRRRH